VKVIQTQNDIEFLKANNTLPLEVINTIEQEFLYLIEEEAADCDPLLFRLPIQKAVILLEAGDDVLGTIGDIIQLEYVEKITERTIDYYRIAKRHDHDIQLIYSLLGIHDHKTEQWLNDQAE
jgi:hypothetical protein